MPEVLRRGQAPPHSVSGGTTCGLVSTEVLTFIVLTMPAAWTTTLGLISSLVIYKVPALPTSTGQFTISPLNRTQALANLAPDKVPITPFILGGSDALPGQYPWVVMVLGNDADGNIVSICTGVLIRPLWVLSARGCVFDESGNVINPSYSAFVGLTNFTNPDVAFESFNFEGETYSPEFGSFITYTTFPPGTVDLAILELSTPSALPHLDVPEEDVPATSLGIVAGWGSVADSATTASEVLQVLNDVPLLPDASCALYEAASFNLTYYTCAGFVNGSDAPCRGDGGAPLIVPNTAAKHGFDLVGTLAAHTVPCSALGAPELFTDLVFVKDVVESVVGPPTTQPAVAPTPGPVSDPGTTTPPECACSCSCSNGFEYEYEHKFSDDACT